MSLVVSECKNCGANLTVDSSKDAVICEFCGTPFIVEKAAINIQGTNNTPSVSNLLQRAQEFELQGNYIVAVEYYERVLDLDYSNTIAREAINRIKNDPILSIPVSGGFVRATLTLTRKSLTYQTKRKEKVIPLESILSVSHFVARLMIKTTDISTSLDLAIGSVKDAKAMEKALKSVLAEKQYFK